MKKLIIILTDICLFFALFVFNVAYFNNNYYQKINSIILDLELSDNIFNSIKDNYYLQNITLEYKWKNNTERTKYKEVKNTIKNGKKKYNIGDEITTYYDVHSEVLLLNKPTGIPIICIFDLIFIGIIILFSDFLEHKIFHKKHI